MTKAACRKSHVEVDVLCIEYPRIPCALLLLSALGPRLDNSTRYTYIRYTRQAMTRHGLHHRHAEAPPRSADEERTHLGR